MPFDAPFTLGPFLVDSKGGLSPGTPDQFPSFRLRWRERWIYASLAAGGADGALALRTTLGRITSTGRSNESHTPEREHAFATLRGLPSLLPEGWTVALKPDHSIAAEARISLSLPTHVERLVTELTLFLYRLAPYLDLLTEDGGMEGVTSPAGSGGTAEGGGAATAARGAGRANT